MVIFGNNIMCERSTSSKVETTESYLMFIFWCKQVITHDVNDTIDLISALHEM